MYHWFCKYWHLNFFSNVVKCIRPTYGNKEAQAPLINQRSNVLKIFLKRIVEWAIQLNFCGEKQKKFHRSNTLLGHSIHLTVNS